jgi:methylated-DNA-[protein]-cysteine S-methyltransferase
MNTDKQIIKWAILQYDQWKLYTAVTDKGLCYVGSPNQSFADFKLWMKKRYPYAGLIENENALKPYMNELREYLEGNRQSFSLSVDVKGTPFQQEIWEALMQIPYGKTCSYSDLAQLVQRPLAVRAVGSAIGANPVLITVPCHRVLGKNGALTGYRGGLDMKQFLLQIESQNGGAM